MVNYGLGSNPLPGVRQESGFGVPMFPHRPNGACKNRMMSQGYAAEYFAIWLLPFPELPIFIHSILKPSLSFLVFNQIIYRHRC